MTEQELELDRHRCECREWLRRGVGKPKEWADRLFADIARKRGQKAADRLRRDLREQRERGNRGEPGDWRD